MNDCQHIRHRCNSSKILWPLDPLCRHHLYRTLSVTAVRHTDDQFPRRSRCRRPCHRSGLEGNAVESRRNSYADDFRAIRGHRLHRRLRTFGHGRQQGLSTTEMKTGDGIYIVAPNSQLWGGALTNFSRNPTRRVQIVLGIDYGDSIDLAIETAKRSSRRSRWGSRIRNRNSWWAKWRTVPSTSSSASGSIRPITGPCSSTLTRH
ncbi:MAG: hypothetical protein EBU57_06270 [Alphaproteobacteria bacterium]|nr:hypothetical protein [Alphaproteobacteria bacterium]